MISRFPHRKAKYARTHAHVRVKINFPSPVGAIWRRKSFSFGGILEECFSGVFLGDLSDFWNKKKEINFVFKESS